MPYDALQATPTARYHALGSACISPCGGGDAQPVAEDRNFWNIEPPEAGQVPGVDRHAALVAVATTSDCHREKYREWRLPVQHAGLIEVTIPLETPVLRIGRLHVEPLLVSGDPGIDVWTIIEGPAFSKPDERIRFHRVAGGNAVQLIDVARTAATSHPLGQGFFLIPGYGYHHYGDDCGWTIQPVPDPPSGTAVTNGPADPLPPPDPGGAPSGPPPEDPGLLRGAGR